MWHDSSTLRSISGSMRSWWMDRGWPCSRSDAPRAGQSLSCHRPSSRFWLAQTQGRPHMATIAGACTIRSWRRRGRRGTSWTCSCARVGCIPRTADWSSCSRCWSLGRLADRASAPWRASLCRADGSRSPTERLRRTGTCSSAGSRPCTAPLDSAGAARRRPLSRPRRRNDAEVSPAAEKLLLSDSKRRFPAPRTGHFRLRTCRGACETPISPTSFPSTRWFMNNGGSRDRLTGPARPSVPPRRE